MSVPEELRSLPGVDALLQHPLASDLTDAHGHWIVEHDLFNHEGMTRDGIAEAFEQFAIKEGLSFF